MTQYPEGSRGPYQLHNAARELFESNAPEVLISGPAGTGKSLACLLKLHVVCEHVPGVRCLILRKTKESLTQSGLVTFEEKVVPAGHPILSVGGQRRNRQSYVYPNGSEIVVGGMDKPSKVMSTEYDLVYVQEAIELGEDEWETLSSRIRNGRLPYQQLFGDTNPDRPTHWLKKRFGEGVLESRHEDNPLLWNGGSWTPQGVEYIERLDRLTGPRLLRLRYGRWVQSEGVVYPEFDPSIHIIDRFDVPRDWVRCWSIDFGYTNPFVWQEWVLDHDDRLYLCREVYMTRRLVEDHAAQIRELTLGLPEPAVVVADHDAEGRATLERHLGVDIMPAVKAVKDGLESVRERLRVQGDGRARLYVMRDALVEMDQDLADEKRPLSTVEEFDAYVMDPKKDAPVKENDHGMDALRYIVHSLDSEVVSETSMRRVKV